MNDNNSVLHTHIPTTYSWLFAHHIEDDILYFQTIDTHPNVIFLYIFILHSTSFNSKIPPESLFSLLYVCHHRRYVKRQINSVT